MSLRMPSCQLCTEQGPPTAAARLSPTLPARPTQTHQPSPNRLGSFDPLGLGRCYPSRQFSAGELSLVLCKLAQMLPPLWGLPGPQWRLWAGAPSGLSECLVPCCMCCVSSC